MVDKMSIYICPSACNAPSDSTLYVNGDGLMPKVYKPGESAPVSGEYEIRGPRGGDTGKERTAIQGRPLPPTPKPGQSYVVHRPAHNGAGKKR
jgi:hypothetical protein